MSNQWIKTANQLPPDNVPVFISWDKSKYHCLSGTYSDQEGWYTVDQEIPIDDRPPVYWMLIPDFPR